MTPSVADKTSTPAKDWRRHTDPPSLWVGVVIGSLSLHLIAFWLIRSYQSNLWRRSQSQTSIPIEIVDISGQSKAAAKAKTASPKLPLSKQKSVPAKLPKTAPTTSTNSDDGAINAVASLRKSDKTRVSQANRQLSAQKTDPQPTPTPTPKPKLAPTPKSTFPAQSRPISTPTPKSTFPTQSRPIPTPIPTPIAKVPLGNLSDRGDYTLGKGTPLPSSIPSIPPETSTGSEGKTPGNSPNSSGSTSQTSTSPIGNNPQTSTSPIGNNPQTSTGGASVATIASLPKDEVNQLIQQRILTPEVLSDVMPVYQGSKTTQFDVSVLPLDSGLQTAKILVSLTIDQNGNFEQTEVIRIEPRTLETQKSRYEQVFNEFFQTEKFIPGHNSDRTTTKPSNLLMWITIKPASPN
ncbi:hypothetical protein NIES2100_55470 [Calothrix sp. NIES-2100]|uniref:hypothetical protein n=1 Tax=Calothrix sp. NIES-2100 TaxID=1954172 RepID=UPI000B5E2359|nr:hypothetical protein NIES2100_55470 [Calothrix sp. NIES-2100]